MLPARLSGGGPVGVPAADCISDSIPDSRRGGIGVASPPAAVPSPPVGSAPALESAPSAPSSAVPSSSSWPNRKTPFALRICVRRTVGRSGLTVRPGVGPS
eukprot:5830582-Prymnesium_polylepis.1